MTVRPVAVPDYLERFKRALEEERSGADEIRLWLSSPTSADL